MNNEWKSYLENNGAIFTEGGETDFAEESSSDCQKINLSHLGVLKVTGEDKVTFLQGQLTSDTRNIEKNKSQLSSYCTPKGRMLASFRIFQHDDAWYLLLPASRLEAIHKRLGMFVLRSQVTIEDVSDDFIVTGLNGDCFTAGMGEELPAEVDAVSHIDGISFIRVEKDKTRFLAIGNFEAIKALWQKHVEAKQASTSQWRLADIKAGIPTVYDQTVESFIPQMTNLQLLNGVSFTKGCYTGQEVVARMQYLGKLKRRMYPVNFETTQAVAAGDDIYSSVSQSGQGAGKIVDVVNTGDNHYEALAVLEINSIGDGNLQLHDSNGAVINISNPPYDFEIDEE